MPAKELTSCRIDTFKYEQFVTPMTSPSKCPSSNRSPRSDVSIRNSSSVENCNNSDSQTKSESTTGMNFIDSIHSKLGDESFNDIPEKETRNGGKCSNEDFIDASSPFDITSVSFSSSLGFHRDAVSRTEDVTSNGDILPACVVDSKLGLLLPRSEFCGDFLSFKNSIPGFAERRSSLEMDRGHGDSFPSVLDEDFLAKQKVESCVRQMLERSYEQRKKLNNSCNPNDNQTYVCSEMTRDIANSNDISNGQVCLDVIVFLNLFLSKLCTN